MPAYEDLAQRQSELIRKALAGSVFAAPAHAPLPERLTGPDAELVPLPQGYRDLGWISKDDGATWSRETELSEITSWGAWEPTRRDIKSDVTSLQIAAQETNIRTIGMWTNTDLSGVRPDPTTGEVSFAQATRPTTQYWRVFALAVDGAGEDSIYLARFLPRAMVSEVDDQPWSSDDDEALVWNMTLTATHDSGAGYSIRHFFGGPGWRKLLDKMGFESEPAGPRRESRMAATVTTTF
ncbi:phage tail tube protein [Saccharopolyspora rosea]|uniref:Uncharacterized protein n=1 Tax=Saccharopolyspora rosea TaxID=524884 RepID=A0ABW3FPW9_9PSEU|nr:hypothetical protein [Saccharopolyspora rosea]